MNILKALRDSYEAQILVHTAQIKMFLENPVGVGEHIDYKSPIEGELKKIAELQDLIDAIETI